jgi:2-amino-4-hydroxy-6-hydroxymethyldihydropteridine diphosphokinase
MDHVRRVVIGLGSNVGDRSATIDEAVRQLKAEPDVHLLRRSPVYESPPAGGPAQSDYLNAAVLLVTAIPARELLQRALAIEVRLGRTRPDSVRWGPRTIDLDLLWIEGEKVSEDGLEIPHVHLRERAFALKPLVDVAPDATDPATQDRYGDLPLAAEPLKLYSVA